jgi:hypothetical protein
MDRPIKFEPWLETYWASDLAVFRRSSYQNQNQLGRRIVSFPGRESTMKQEAEAVQPETLVMTVSMVLDQKRLQRFKPPQQRSGSSSKTIRSEKGESLLIRME